MPDVYGTYDAALAAALESDDDLAVNGVRIGSEWRYFLSSPRASDADMWIRSLEIRSGKELTELQKSTVQEMVDKGLLEAGNR